MTGSSPLARGLRARVHPRHRPPQDHPRSRGVYSSAEVKTSSPCGSSPLARGLHSERLRRGAHVRIIPARAGFTSGGSASVTRTTDHPRSRGVYFDFAFAAAWLTGSSPLARGLRDAPHHSHCRVGIIPARAGFTRPRDPGDRPTRDHPRSRGVYTRAPLTARRRLGSSPLARGLRDGCRLAVAQFGIIPARAGFTGVWWVVRSGVRDHPRSRGVYIRPATSSHRFEGSSPLARGLRRCGVPVVSRGWIIPARAGFTGQSGGGNSRLQDHPRSRGVYPARSRTERSGRGSSPLARGLRGLRNRRRRRRRIIPARAGFTRPRPAATSRSPDHPRSRGVYVLRIELSWAWYGSSPLARGLQRIVTREDIRAGIIPARAGFTGRRTR